MNMEEYIKNQEEKIKVMEKMMKEQLKKVYDEINLHYNPPAVRIEDHYNAILNSINRQTAIIEQNAIKKYNEVVGKVKKMDSLVVDIPAKIKFTDLNSIIYYFILS